MPILPGDMYEFPTVDWWWRCPKCRADFVPSITEQDTVFYDNPFPIPRTLGEKRVVTLEGGKCPNGCNGGPFKQELEFNPVQAGEKGWEPTTHNQTCPICDEHYHLDWTVTERNYF